MALSKIKGTVIADDAINADRIADGTVVASDLLDNTLTGAKLATDIAITTSGNITTTGNLTSTGIDDNATSTAITIDSSQQVGIGYSGTLNGQLNVNGNVGLGNFISASNPTGGTYNLTDPDGKTINQIVRIGEDDDGSINTIADLQLVSYGQAANGGGGNLRFVNSRYSDDVALIKGSRENAQTGYLAFYTENSGLKERMHIHDNGDISFYEDTGTTPKFFWDASAEALGIGTSSPDADLHISDSSSTIRFTDEANSQSWQWQAANDRFEIRDVTQAVERFTVLSSGNVGIGTISPAPAVGSDTALEIAGSTSPGLVINDTGQAQKYQLYADSTKFKMSYGSTGFFTYDASSGDLGIGTNTPSRQLEIYDDGTIGQAELGITAQNTDPSRIFFADPDDVNPGILSYDHSDDSMRFHVNNAERMRIDSSGNVGIGTSSPSNFGNVNNRGITVNGQGTAGFVEMQSSGTAYGAVFANSNNAGIRSITALPLTFETNTTERMRIDSSGNLLVNKTALDNSVEGFSVGPDNYVAVVRDGGRTMILNRKTSDGQIIEFRKDGTAVGAIGHENDLVIYSTVASHSGLRFSTNSILPTNNSGIDVNDTIDLGNNTRKFDDIYATNGTIQTSDQNEKQSIQSLTTAEMNVAKRLSPLIKTFKWNSAVEEKGDSARTHTGIIAQDVQQAFTDEGLDAGNYALFISSTWWEKEISVEATEEKEAYTYTDIKEEATDGYTEKTRLGVRYPELLSFIQAYNDQRFTELEARITALENNQP